MSVKELNKEPKIEPKSISPECPWTKLTKSILNISFALSMIASTLDSYFG